MIRNSNSYKHIFSKFRNCVIKYISSIFYYKN